MTPASLHSWISIPVALLMPLFLLRAQVAQPPVVPDGERIERSIRAQETHHYRIPAQAGQSIRVLFEQKGADVELALTSPEARQVGFSDLPNIDWGPESIAVIAESAGIYTLDIAVLAAKAPSGNYEFRVVVRDATPEDTLRAAAEKSIGDALRLRRTRAPGFIKLALAEYEKALPFFHANGDRYREALLHSTIGLVLAQSGDMRAALTHYETAAETFISLGDKREEATARNNAGGAWDVLGDFPKAFENYSAALRLNRALGGGARLRVISNLNNIAKLHGDRQEWQQCLDAYREALALAEEVGTPQLRAIVLQNLGGTFVNLHQVDLGRDYYFRSLEQSRLANDETGQATALESLGILYRDSDRQKALSLWTQALTLHRKKGDKRAEGRVLYRAAALKATQGDEAQALADFGASMAILKGVGDTREIALAARSLASVYLDSGEPLKAVAYAEQALTAFRAIGDRLAQAGAQRILAEARRALGEPREALRLALDSLALAEAVRSGVASEQVRAGYIGSDLGYFLATDLQMELGETDAALATNERARARSLVESLAEGGVNGLGAADLKLVERRKELANQMNAKSARLLPLMGQTTPRVAALQEELRSLESAFNDLEAEIRRNNSHLASLVQPQPLTLKQIQSDVLDDNTVLLEYALGEKRSYLWVVGKTSLHSFTLPGSETLDRQSRAVYDLLTARATAVRGESAAQRAARIVKADADYAIAVRELSEMVLGAARSQLGTKRIVVVADGALQRFPFSVLPTASGAPLIATNEVVMLPSASALVELRKEAAARQPAPKTLAVFADAVFGQADERMRKGSVTSSAAKSPEATRILEHLAEPANADSSGASMRIPRLPFTRLEADEILRVASGSGNLRAFGFDASRALAISGALSEYRYLHFATHGYLDTEHPNLSALVLAQYDSQGKPLDGFLRAGDIYNSHLKADLVVLSACQTGLGKEVSGEGLMGLTRAFLYAGAPRVVVSLWNVNDKATADLMAVLYRRILRNGDRPSAALRAAQLEIGKRTRWAAPYYWAAFVQQGDWQ